MAEGINKRIILVSNRLPVQIETGDEGPELRAASGGLVTALAPLIRKAGGTWIGWPGCDSTVDAGPLLDSHSSDLGYRLKAVSLSQDQIRDFYRGFANQSIWPLFHDLLGQASFHLPNWEQYCAVNRLFAKETFRAIDDDCFVWIHDYQLLMVGKELRELGYDRYLHFFLHIPFPSRDLFQRFPWRDDLLRGMLEYDHLGFQTEKDKRNFLQCVRAFVPEAAVRSKRFQSQVGYEGRTIKVGNYPISIDFTDFDSGARTEDVANASWYIKENVRADTLALGLDRLDYTKGIGQRFLSWERALEKYPELIGKLSLLQVVVPSRLNVPEYQDIKVELDQLAGRINGRFSEHGWIPIHYMFRRLDRVQLLGHYRACEIALITPLRDGMNLVAKEYCAASVDEGGVLILSEFAGAAAQLDKGALVVNPYDVEGTADAIYAAFSMDPQERAARMRKLRMGIRCNDVHRWVSWFMEELPTIPEESLA